MAVIRSETDFTLSQIKTLRRLVRQETKRLGYGTKYDEDNKPLWPKNLQALITIMRKLNKLAYYLYRQTDLSQGSHTEGNNHD